MAIHPGCGYPTQFAAKIIAVCDLVFGLVGIFWFVYILDGYGLLMEDPSIYNPANQQSTVTPVIIPSVSISTLSTTALPTILAKNGTDPTMGHHPIVSVTSDGIQINGQTANIFLSAFYTLVNLGAFVLLLSGAHQKNILKLKIWFAIRLAIFLFKIVVYSIYLIVGAKIFGQTPHILFMVVHLYGLWIVYVFIKEIRAEQEQNAASSTSAAPENATTYNGSGYINFINSVEENKA